MFNCRAIILLTGFVSGTVGSAISPEDLSFFESKIRPALIEHCYECHSEESGKRKGGLLLDRRDGWLLGGDSGTAAVAGNPDDSLLIQTIRYQDPDLEMPPKAKLPASVVADFEEWVSRGLPDPRDGSADAADEGFDFEKRKQYWAYQPKRSDFGNRTGIDDFIDESIQEQGLEVLPAASPEARLRRAKVDLAGLIPTEEEVMEFLADSSSDSWEGLVDRWLNSDEFGETWARHWLDIVRYADSSGGGRAMPFPDAWRFRNYVIDSFREDRPLDLMIREQIAGDLLPYDDLKERQRNLIASGFLVMGPNNYENQNKAELDFEIIDEQIDTIGRAFLGQTIGCARCHDHKFDPIPTKDYYALAGIFKSTDFVTHSNVSKWQTEPIPPTPEAQAALRASEEEFKRLGAKIADLKKELADMGVGAGGSSRNVEPVALPGVVVDNVDAELSGEWVESTSTPRWVGDSYIHDGNDRAARKSVTFRMEVPDPGSYEVRLSYSADSNRNTATPVTVKAGDFVFETSVNQRVEPEHDKLFETLVSRRFAGGETVTVIVGNRPDGDGHVIADAAQLLFVETEPEPQDELVEDRASVSRLKKQLAEAESKLKQHKKEAPKIPMAMCVVDRPASEIGDVEIRIRGVESNRGSVAPRGFLQAAKWDGMDEGGSFAISGASSGRLEFARWITDSQNPLTARVLANRIWLKLMGEGLVTTPDNFGLTGAMPTHPELLDYLALRLIESGWSAKALIREIMMSEVYSRCSRTSGSESAETDPGNQYYWRAHLRPLTAEALRDSMLAVSGELDREMAQASLPPGFKSEFGHKFTTQKRSIYVPVFRNAGYEMFSIFDFANPNFSVGKRARSIIPTQALFLTNNPFIHERAKAAAELLKNRSSGELDDAIELAFVRTIGRKPEAEEAAMAHDFFEKGGDWTAFQRALFASIDFRFLR